MGSTIDRSYKAVEETSVRTHGLRIKASLVDITKAHHGKSTLRTSIAFGPRRVLR